MNKQVIFIAGTGHCGSTLIDLVLGSNDEVKSLGELKSLQKNVPPYNQFWTPELISKLKTHYRYKNNRIISYNYHRFPKSKLFENRSHLYSTLFENSKGERILIDSSKDLFWIKRGYFHLQNSQIASKILHIEREPIAVINSYSRKYPERAFDLIVKDIKRRIEKNNKFLGDLPNEKKYSVNYESFCKNPEYILKGLCDFLRIEFSGKMLRYWETEHDIIGGNSGTRSLISNKQNGMGKRSDSDYYKRNGREIKLDERWKMELNKEQIEIFENIFYQK